MKQAKVITDVEMKRLLAVIASARHAERTLGSGSLRGKPSPGPFSGTMPPDPGLPVR